MRSNKKPTKAPWLPVRLPDDSVTILRAISIPAAALAKSGELTYEHVKLIRRAYKIICTNGTAKLWADRLWNTSKRARREFRPR